MIFAGNQATERKVNLVYHSCTTILSEGDVECNEKPGIAPTKGLVVCLLGIVVNKMRLFPCSRQLLIRTQGPVGGKENAR